MRKLIVIVVVLVAVLTAIWFGMRGSVTPSAHSIPSTLSPAPVHEDVVEAATALSPSQPPPEVTERAIVETVAPVPQEAAQEGPTLAEIRGRFLFPGGEAAGGVSLQVHGWQSNNERVLKYGEPEDWKDPSGSTGPDGRFSLRFDPPRAYQFVLDATLKGWCEASWRWSEIEPTSTVDVGDVELVKGGSVRGRIVDSGGRALTEGWMVYADSTAPVSHSDPKGGRDETRVMAAPDQATGEFLLEGVPPGRIRLKAYSQIANWIEGPSVDVRAGEETTADIAYSGPNNESRIVVIPFCRPFYVFEGDPAEVLLSAPGFETRKSTKLKNSSQSFPFDNLPPGSYTVEIQDPRFEPWSKSGVRPGQRVQAHLKGNAAISLQPVDEGSGEPIKAYSLDVRFENVNFSPNTFRVHEAKEDPPANGVFDGLIPGDQTVIVRCDGYAACEVPVLGLKPNETRSIAARLGHGVRLVGRVVTGANKKPLPGAKIALLPGAIGEEEAMFPRDERDIDAKAGESDAQGKFGFDGLAPGPWTLRVDRGPLFSVRQEVVVSKEKEGDEIEIAMPAPGYLAGRLIGPKGASFRDIRVLVQPSAKEQEVDGRAELPFFMSSHELAVPVSEDGTFRAGPLPAGAHEVSMCMPPIEIPTGDSGSMTSDGMVMQLGVVTLAPDADTQQEFDVRASFPGSMAIRLRVNGAPAPSVIIRVEDEVKGQLAAVLTLDPRGEGKTGPILPGVYRLISGPVDSGWVHQTGPTRIGRPGEVVAVEVEVHLLRGVLKVIDEGTDAPLAKAQISLSIDTNGEFSPSAHSTTDDKGSVTFELPPGRYRVDAGGFPGFSPPGSRVIVDWTSAGPVPPEVRVKPFEFPK